MDTMKGFMKLRGKPEQVELFTQYREKAGSMPEKQEYEPEPESVTRPWMHPLTADEMTEVEAVGVEAFRAFEVKGAAKEDAYWRSRRAEALALLMFSLRVSPEPKSPQLFHGPEELILLPYPETIRLEGLYYRTFRPSREEIKNSLRERLGLGSETEPSSPKN